MAGSVADPDPDPWNPYNFLWIRIRIKMIPIRNTDGRMDFFCLGKQEKNKKCLCR